MARRRGRIVVGVAVVALAGAVVAVRAQGSDPAPSGSRAVRLPDRSYQVGECVTWEPEDAAAVWSRGRTVPCSEEHLREVVGVIDLRDLDGDYPSEAEWDRLADRCDPIVDEHLGGYLNSILHPISPGTLTPDATVWAEGRQEVVCVLGLRHLEPGFGSGQLVGRLPVRGPIRDVDVVSPFEVGDCHRRGLGGEFEIVSCDEPHRYEVTGIVDLRDPATRANDADEIVAIERAVCPELLRARVGVEPEPGVMWTRLPIDQAAFDGGVRGLVCLAHRFQDGSQVDLEGPLVP